MKQSNKAILPKLLSKADELAVVKGRLVITPASGKQVPDKWLIDNESLLLIEILNLLNIDAYRYTDYSTGRYKAPVNGKEILCPGITLQFKNVENDNEAHAILNADITRTRNSKHGKAGEDLPRGQFRVRPKHNFHKFWRATGLKFPVRNSAFHDYMGKLKGVIYVGELGHKDKFRNKTLRPLELSFELIKAAYIQSFPDNIQTLTKQQADNFQTIIPNKETTSKLASNDVGVYQSTGKRKYGLSLQGSTVTSNALPIVNTLDTLPIHRLKKSPQEQTNDEWMTDYDNATAPQPDDKFRS